MTLKQTKKSGPKALPFVVESNGRLEVCKEVEEFLTSLEPPFAVVCVAGAYRTGKSCLLNRGILGTYGEKQGFSVGSTVNACTKGLHLFNSVIEHEGQRMIVIDSEGTRSLTQNAEADSKLIALSLLLCSVFVYNSMGTIDETTLSSLGVFASVAKAIAADDPSAFANPYLFWVLRDFHLEVKSEDGQSLTPNEYLENILNAQGQEDDLRHSLRTQFPKRCLFPLVRPVEKESDLINLTKLADSALRPEFIQQLQHFRKWLGLNGPVKTLGKSPLSGKVLLTMAKHHCSRINEGHAPSIKDTFAFMIENEMLRWSSEIDKVTLSRWDLLVSKLPVAPNYIDQLIADEVIVHLSQGNGFQIMDEALDRFNALKLQKCEEIKIKITKRNEDMCTQWIRQEFKNCEKADNVVDWFRGYLTVCVDKIGESKTIQTLNLFVDTVIGNIQKDLQAKITEAGDNKSKAQVLEERLAKVILERDEVQKALEAELVSIKPDTVTRAEYTLLENEISEKMKAIAFLESEMAYMQAKTNESDHQKEGDDEPSVENDNLSALHETIHHLEHALKDKEMTCMSIRTQLEELEISRKKEIETMVASMQAATAKAESDFLAEKKKYVQQSQDLQQKLSAAIESKTELEAQLREIRHECDVSKAALKAQATEHDEKFEAARKESVEKLRAHVNSISASFEQTRHELAEARARSLESDRAKAIADGQCESLKRKLEIATETERVFKSTKTELQSVKTQMIEAQAKNKSYELLVAELQERCRSSEAQLRKSQADIALLERQHTVEKARLEIMMSGQSAAGLAPQNTLQRPEQ